MNHMAVACLPRSLLICARAAHSFANKLHIYGSIRNRHFSARVGRQRCVAAQLHETVSCLHDQFYITARPVHSVWGLTED